MNTPDIYREAAAECITAQNEAIRKARAIASTKLFDADRRRAFKAASSAGDGYGECAALYCTLASNAVAKRARLDVST